MNAMLALILAAAAAAQTAPSSVGASSASAPTEIVVRGEGGKLSDAKPPLKMEVDAFETIRHDVLPDDDLLLAASPLTVAWRRTHPDFLMSERVIEPWLTTFSERTGLPFMVREQLERALDEKLDERSARAWSWSLTIADEDGRPFHHVEGSGPPPVEWLWSGQNAQGQWLSAGRPYSPVYRFSARGQQPRTLVGSAIQLKGVVHQEDGGLHLTLDSSSLFGAARTDTELSQPDGADLMRSAADLIKRRYAGLPLTVTVYANTQKLAEIQAAVVQTYLLRELMLSPRYATVQGEAAPFADQRVEIVMLNR